MSNSHLSPVCSRVPNEAILSLTIHRGGERNPALAAGERCVAPLVSRLFRAIAPRAAVPRGKREARFFQEPLRLRNDRVSKFAERESCSAGASVHGEPFLLAASGAANFSTWVSLVPNSNSFIRAVRCLRVLINQTHNWKYEN